MCVCVCLYIYIWLMLIVTVLVTSSTSHLIFFQIKSSDLLHMAEIRMPSTITQKGLGRLLEHVMRTEYNQPRVSLS